MTVDEFIIWPTECEYCNDDDRVLYFWRGDVWCARCLTEAVNYHGLMFESYEPYIWQTPDGYIRFGRRFNGVFPRL